VTARRFVLGLCLLVPAVPAVAQSVITSPGPDRVEVTVYRDPHRAPEDAFNLRMLNGYALISETRRVSLPAGESEIRFEGVAGGIIPQSAIIAGFPEGIVERNRDALLLSPATLIDASLGRRVSIRRTSRATGAVSETEAVILSGANGGVVLQTPAGFEALRCTGLPESLLHPALPPGLAPRPTLSVRTRAGRPVTATVRLAYLASGFDWQANYVATLADDGSHINLLAWLTLGSNDETSFVNADTQAVAGRLNREPVAEQPREGGPLTLRCWPQATTSDIPLEQFRRMAFAGGIMDGDDIVITGSRNRRANLESATPITTVSADEIAVQEELGDLKLYRIPMPVTVAANGQKQVAFLSLPEVRAELYYMQNFYPDFVERPDMQPVRRLVLNNREENGLGVPLPGGRLVLLSGGDRPILLGEGAIGDRAIREEADINLGPVPGVTSHLRRVGQRGNVADYELVVSNANRAPIPFRGSLIFPNVRSDVRLERRRPGAEWLWRTEVPANGRATLRFSAAARRTAPRR
jgi:hypothetical protein